MSSFVIKLIAIISMICDHTSDALIGHLSFLNILGRIAFPLFCFQLVIGYKHTKNVGKYLLRLFIFGIISQIPFSLFTFSCMNIYNVLNIFFTLSLGLLAIYTLDKLPNKWIAILIDIFIIIFAKIINVDYGWFGICLILCIFIFYKDKHEEKKKMDKSDFLYPLRNNILFTIVFFILCILKYFNSFYTTSIDIIMQQLLATFFPIIFMLLYNGKKGPSFKYFFYAFYPIHLVILTVLHYIFL